MELAITVFLVMVFAFICAYIAEEKIGAEFDVTLAIFGIIGLLAFGELIDMNNNLETLIELNQPIEQVEVVE